MRTRTITQTRELPNDSIEAAADKAKIFRQVDSLLEHEGPLDEQDQEQVIRGFEELQLRQARLWKTLFGCLSLLLGAFYMHAAWSQHNHPWELRYVGEFQSVVQHGPAIAALLLQASALLVCGQGLLVHVPPKGDRERGCMPATMQQQLSLWGSTLLSACGAAFWIHKMMQMRVRFGRAGDKWELSWVPLAPLLCCLICLGVSASLEATAAEVARLKAMRYQHKKV